MAAELSSYEQDVRVPPLSAVAFNLDDLLQETFEPLRYVIPEVLPEGLTLFFSRPKIGKSMVALYLALRMGLRVGGIGGETLYLTLDDTSKRRLQDRARSLLQGTELGRDVWAATKSCTLDKGMLIAQLHGWLIEHPETRLVIVDVYGKVKPRRVSDDVYKNDYDAVDALREFAERHHLAILLVHHTRKQVDTEDWINNANGSAGLTGGSDTCWTLERQRGSQEMYLKVTGRDVEDLVIQIDLGDLDAPWVIQGAAALGSEGAQALLAALAASEGPMTPKELTAATGLSHSHVFQLCRRLKSRGQIAQTTYGKYTLPPGAPRPPVTPPPAAPRGPIAPCDRCGETAWDREDGDWTCTSCGLVHGTPVSEIERARYHREYTRAWQGLADSDSLSPEPPESESAAAPAVTPDAPLAQQYAEEALGVTWRETPARVGHALILKLNVRRSGWYDAPGGAYEQIAEAPDHRGEGLDLAWRRLPTDVERTWPCAHAYDRTAAFLSVCGSAYLPVGKPAWVPDAVYAKQANQGARAGFWRVRVSYHGSPWDGSNLPAVCPEGDGVWLWTPTLRTALALGYAVEPAGGAILWDGGQHVVLRTWQQQIWSARQALLAGGPRFADAAAAAEAVQLIKQVYTRTIGTFALNAIGEEVRDGRDVQQDKLPRWYRPEWNSVIVAEAIARMFVYAKKAVDAGRAPLWMRADTIAFAGREPPEKLAALVGLNVALGQCGAFRYLYSLPLGELVQPEGRTVEASDGEWHALPTVRGGR